MSYHMSDLPVVGLNSGYESQFEGSKYRFPVVFIQHPEGNTSWRGIGQILPRGQMIGVGFVWFAGDNDGSYGVGDDWPLDIIPTFVEVDSDLFEIWSDLTWDDHDINWASNGHGRLIAAQFCRK